MAIRSPKKPLRQITTEEIDRNRVPAGMENKFVMTGIEGKEYDLDKLFYNIRTSSNNPLIVQVMGNEDYEMKSDSLIKDILRNNPDITNEELVIEFDRRFNSWYNGALFVEEGDKISVNQMSMEELLFGKRVGKIKTSTMTNNKADVIVHQYSSDETGKIVKDFEIIGYVPIEEKGVKIWDGPYRIYTNHEEIISGEFLKYGCIGEIIPTETVPFMGYNLIKYSARFPKMENALLEYYVVEDNPMNLFDIEICVEC